MFDDKGTPKICDFGVSRILHVSGFTTPTIGTTPAYLAPEILKKLIESEVDPTKVTSKAGDIYAFAIMAAEVCVRMENICNSLTLFKQIFMEKEYGALRNQAQNNRRPPEDQTNSKYFPLLADCWTSNPDERLQIEDVIHSLEHIRQIGRYEPGTTWK